ncbi:MAG: type II toxin-antitoxin system RelE/ParE family toxin [Calothrix sp. MO_167.B42]|nr:type II toxin-antitoxin system RelE/ParE family toxin [Calothrix sp. MO_167.B42]
MIFRDLIILPEAEQDAAEAYAWYEQQESGLGEEFLRCVDACIQSIRRNPQIYRIIHESYRRAVLRRFPYVIFYEFVDETIIIYSVFHCSQDPNKWRSRLS